MEKLLKIPYKVFNDWNLLQQFLERKGNPKYELVGDVDIDGQEDIVDLGNLVRVDGTLYANGTSIYNLTNLTRVDGDLQLPMGTQSLGKLEYVGGDYHADLSYWNKSLGNLKYVGGTFSGSAEIKSLGNLEYVGKILNLRAFTSLETLGNLKHVGYYIKLSQYNKIPKEELAKFKIEKI